ncbi:MAG: ATP-dependent Clp protease ATP-binding subunit ClpA, partial [Pseudomonadota bacterium]
NPVIMEKIVDKFIKEICQQLSDRKVTLELTPAARTYLAQEGYDPQFGARPLARVLQQKIKRPLSEELLFGRLEKGGKVTVDYQEGALSLNF